MFRLFDRKSSRNSKALTGLSNLSVPNSNAPASSAPNSPEPFVGWRTLSQLRDRGLLTGADQAELARLAKANTEALYSQLSRHLFEENIEVLARLATSLRVQGKIKDADAVRWAADTLRRQLP